MQKNKKKNRAIISLIILSVTILIGGVLFAGALSGWLDDPKTVLDPEYYSDTPEIIPIDKDGYEGLTGEKKSFLLFIDQNGCVTADRVRGYVEKYAKEKNVSIYKIMFSDAKDSSLHEFIKYYPSVVVVDEGKVRVYLRADSDDDADAYNDYDAFLSWLERYL